MPIPKYDELTWPILQILKDGQPHSTHDLAKALSDQFGLTEEERNALLPSGVQTYMLNRAGWAGFHLDRAGLVARPKRGRWQITPEGLRVATSPARKLDRQALCEFPAFANYLAGARAGKSNSAPLQSDDNVADIDTPPEEQIATASKALRAGLKQDLLETVRRMDPIKFERLVLDLLLAMGYGGSREEPHRGFCAFSDSNSEARAPGFSK